MSQQSFLQKTALVTGGCGGLGRSISEAFLLAGANVVVVDINAELVADFKTKVSSAYPECTLAVQADITKDEKIEEVFSEGEKMFGGIDFVVNCAGRIDRFDAVAEMVRELMRFSEPTIWCTLADFPSFASQERLMWDKVIALNLTAPAIVSGRAIRKWLEERKKGSIVNIASIAGFRGFTCGILPAIYISLVPVSVCWHNFHHRRCIHSE
jgi:NAD(P)-dependent dehydrogenase (short-subunit alcohol dehydrogenase family)